MRRAGGRSYADAGASGPGLPARARLVGQIREAVLGWESDADDAAISMQVSRARRKLSEAGADPIATVWGMGYKWQL